MTPSMETKRSRLNLNDSYRSTSSDNIGPTCPIDRDRAIAQRKMVDFAKSSNESLVMDKSILS
jgi:hypothetical protein